MKVVPKIWTAAVFTSVLLMAQNTCVFSEQNEGLNACQKEKINFDLDRIGGDGDGAGGFSDYEFCIPYDKTYLDEVIAINPDIHCYEGSKGRIGCQENERLCFGQMRKGKGVLCALSHLGYVKSIEPSFWE